MATPARNANVVALFPLQEVIFNKDGTGPLAAGVVSFYSDPDFTVPKDVYEETLNPLTGSIEYTDLGYVLILSGIGSFVDGIGNNFIPLLYPYVGSPTDTVLGAFEPYFITVYSSDGIFQFSTSDWPPNSFSESAASTSQEALTNNLLTNSQFSIVSFIPNPTTLVYRYTVSGTETNILAPGWTLNTIGTGTIDVSQTILSSSIPSESPYALELTWSTGLTSLQVVQQLTNSPRIIAGSIGSASLVIQCPNSQAIGVELHYISGDSSPIDVEFVAAMTDMASNYTTISGSKLIPSTGTQSASGYVDFVIDITSLASSSSINITSAQLVEVADVNIIAEYIQETTQQQLNGLMWYYEPQLAYKPIPSWLVGWDFPLNPAQNGTVIGSSAGANKSFYTWDQTIIFQSVNSSMQTSRVTGDFFSISASVSGQMAIIQYLPSVPAQEILNDIVSVYLSAFSVAPGPVPYAIQCTVSLWVTADPSLPSMSSNNSLVLTLDANGKPASFNGTWVEIAPLNGQDITFDVISYPVALNAKWNNNVNNSLSNTATFFAIVIGFATVPINNSIVFRNVALQSGSIATRPAPQTLDEVLRECQYYYETSYDVGVIPGTSSSTNGSMDFPQITNLSNGITYNSVFNIRYNTTKIISSPLITIYNPSSGSSNSAEVLQWVAGSQSVSNYNTFSTAWTAGVTGEKGVSFVPNSSSVALITSGAGANISGSVRFQYTADARLGTY